MASARDWLRRIATKSLTRERRSPLETERAEWGYYLSNIGPGMIIFDVGAYIGDLTLLFSHFAGPNGRIHAFEASSQNYKDLCAICRIANLDNVVTNHAAASDHEGVAQLAVYDAGHRSWSTLADRPLQDYGISIAKPRRESVRLITLDKYCMDKKINEIDLLKIDVEGAELQVLYGCRRLFAEGAIKRCVFEFGQTTFDMGNSPEEIEDFVRSVGYKLRNIIAGLPVFPGGASPETAQFAMIEARRK